MIRITGLKLNLDAANDYASQLANLRKLVVSTYKIVPNQLMVLKIYKRALDARRKNNIHFVYTVDIELPNEKAFLDQHPKLKMTPNLDYIDVEKGNKDLVHPPVIVGFGPSGMFAALLLARRGYSPIILERGLDIAKRTKAWNDFLSTRKFNELGSILFGEGGAGTFSDGKLTTMISDLRSRFILEEFVKAGAHPEIMYVNKPHIGTDVLKIVTKHIREEIINCGGIIRFNTKVTDFIINNGQLEAVIVNEKERIPTEICLLGIGHSSRDTYQLLLDKAFNIEPKPFSVGVRIEHLQETINKSQYGASYIHPALGPADYKLSYHSPSGRNAYTFCMCPGGYVVNAASEEHTVVTNGMSFSKRDGKNANSAILVNVTPKDFKTDHPLSGVSFQKEIEKKAFSKGKSPYNTPVQLVGDFLNDKPTEKIGTVLPSIQPGYDFVELKEIFPDYVIETLKEAILDFNKKIKGFASDDAVLTAPETRSSSPIRMLRNEIHESNIKGVYPMGEGAGYAGGIMSSAVDGMKTAEKIISNFVF